MGPVFRGSPQQYLIGQRLKCLLRGRSDSHKTQAMWVNWGHEAGPHLRNSELWFNAYDYECLFEVNHCINVRGLSSLCTWIGARPPDCVFHCETVWRMNDGGGTWSQRLIWDSQMLFWCRLTPAGLLTWCCLTSVQPLTPFITVLVSGCVFFGRATDWFSLYLSGRSFSGLACCPTYQAENE